MIFIAFIISFIGLFLFFILKILEMNTGRRILSIIFLDKSDIFINRNIVRIKFYFNFVLFKSKKIPLFINFLLKGLLNKVKLLKDFLILKIVDYLNLDNIKNIEKNKGSVSLFLKNISNDKKTSVKLNEELK